MSILSRSGGRKEHRKASQGADEETGPPVREAAVPTDGPQDWLSRAERSVAGRSSTGAAVLEVVLQPESAQAPVVESCTAAEVTRRTARRRPMVSVTMRRSRPATSHRHCRADQVNHPVRATPGCGPFGEAA
jgi:hypothetical protein